MLFEDHEFGKFEFARVRVYRGGETSFGVFEFEFSNKFYEKRCVTCILLLGSNSDHRISVAHLWMPPKRKGAAPAPGAAGALASALNVTKFMRIKPGDLQHEVDVERCFSIPGSFWGDQCNKGDGDQMYAAKVVEVILTHKFQGTAMKQPALRFVLTGAASSTVDGTPL